MHLRVAVLCAAWCSTCREFSAVVERIAAARPDVRFLWLDIEDDVERCGDIEVENFPTLAVFRGDALLHYGPSLPQERPVTRLLDGLSDGTRAALQGVVPEVARLATLFNEAPVAGDTDRT